MCVCVAEERVSSGSSLGSSSGSKETSPGGRPALSKFVDDLFASDSSVDTTHENSSSKGTGGRRDDDVDSEQKWTTPPFATKTKKRSDDIFDDTDDVFGDLEDAGASKKPADGMGGFMDDLLGGDTKGSSPGVGGGGSKRGGEAATKEFVLDTKYRSPPGKEDDDWLGVSTPSRSTGRGTGSSSGYLPSTEGGAPAVSRGRRAPPVAALADTGQSGGGRGRRRPAHNYQVGHIRVD